MNDTARVWRRCLVGIFAVALLIRIAPLFTLTMWYDEAVEGLMSQDVLRGRFPMFFYGQPVHGVADRYFAALAVLVLGPTTLALKLPMLALFFAFLASVAYTTRRMFGPRVAVLAVLFVAVPPYYYFGWNFDSRGHYSLMLLLGVWLLYLAWRIGQEGVAEAAPRRFVGLGLLAGLAWWTNYLSVTFLAPIALGLGMPGARALRRVPRAVLERAALAGVGVVVGLAPLLAYHLSYGVPLRPPGRGAGFVRAAAHAAALVVDALPPTLGVHPEIWGRAFGAVYGAIGGLTAGAILYGALWWRRARRTPGGGGSVGALLGLVLITCLLSIATQYGATLRYPRYLLPLMLALPVLLGLLLDGVGRVSAVAKWGLVAFVVLSNLLGSLRLTPILAEGASVEHQRRWAVRARLELEFLEREGIRHVYGGWNHWPFLSDRRVVAADPYQERMAEFVREVDAAERVAWVFGGPARAFEDSARAAGIAFRRVAGPGFVAYTDFAVGPTGYVDMSPAGWSASASHRSAEAALAHDRRLDTAWGPGAPQAPGQFYQLDLGRSERIGLVAWMPWHFQETPAGFRVSVSRDGVGWEPVADVPAYFGPLYWSGMHPFQRVRRGRVEVRFEPVEARHVRIELTATGRVGWSMREVVVARPGGVCPRRYDPGALVALLRGAGVTHAYADHWISANIAKHSAEGIRVLPSNVSVNSYRLERPHPDTIELVRPQPGRALVVEDCPGAVADAVGAVLEESGVRARRAAAGGFVVFTELEASDTGGEAVAWRGPEEGRLEVWLKAARPVRRVVVECEGSGGAGEVVVQGTADGERWEAVSGRMVQRGKLRMSGSRLYRDGVESLAVEFTPRSWRGIRVGLEGAGTTWCPLRAVRLGFAP